MLTVETTEQKIKPNDLVRRIKFEDDTFHNLWDMPLFGDQFTLLNELVAKRESKCLDILKPRELMNVGKEAMEVYLNAEKRMASEQKTLGFLFGVILPAIRKDMFLDSLGEAGNHLTDEEFTTKYSGSLAQMSWEEPVNYVYKNLALIRNLGELRIFFRAWQIRNGSSVEYRREILSDTPLLLMGSRAREFADSMYYAHHNQHLWPGRSFYREYR